MTSVTVTRRLRRTVLALLILLMGTAGVAAQPQGGAPVAANAPPAVAPATPAFATARDAFGRKDYAAALRAFRQGADGGDASSMAGVGALYALGAGMPANDGEALRWFKKAAANDTSWAPEVNRLLNAGDLHTVYLTEPEMRELTLGTRGEFGGLGIEITLADGRPSVVAPIDDTPAAHAGVQGGDVFLRIDDAPTDGLSLNEVVQRLRGRVGTSVRLTIKRAEREFDVSITRATIRVRAVKSKLLDGGVGWLRITQFNEQTDQNVVASIDAMARQAGGALTGLVLDLRHDPGGLLTQSIAVTGRFIDGGVVVRTSAWAGRSHANDNAYQAPGSGGDMLRGAPIVVLVNGASASAAEIVAGALQDHRRAPVLGTPSFGKGTVQTIFPLEGHGGLKVTTAEYRLPSGRSIQARGITPDELVLPAPDERAEGTPTNEAKLRGQEPSAPLEPNIDGKLIGTDRDQQLKVAAERVRTLAAQRPPPAPPRARPSTVAPLSGQQ